MFTIQSRIFSLKDKSMLKYLLLLFSISLFSCASQKIYTWQDMRMPAREHASMDLEECRAYAARQYKPGTPTGEPYLRDNHKQDYFFAENEMGTWRPDRNPTSTININSEPIHDVPTEYTGYPGELDYHPHYLDDILEKCMSDRGWEYRPEPDKSNE
jgi:hypothetical protein